MIESVDVFWRDGGYTHFRASDVVFRDDVIVLVNADKVAKTVISPTNFLWIDVNHAPVA